MSMSLRGSKGLAQTGKLMSAKLSYGSVETVVMHGVAQISEHSAIGIGARQGLVSKTPKP